MHESERSVSEERPASPTRPPGLNDLLFRLRNNENKLQLSGWIRTVIASIHLYETPHLEELLDALLLRASSTKGLTEIDIAQIDSFTDIVVAVMNDSKRSVPKERPASPTRPPGLDNLLSRLQNSENNFQLFDLTRTVIENIHLYETPHLEELLGVLLSRASSTKGLTEIDIAQIDSFTDIIVAVKNRREHRGS